MPHPIPPSGPRVDTLNLTSGYGYCTCIECSELKTLERLNQHLQSPRHEDKIYRCPKSDCRTEFVTLSGLCQHVEGGSCGVRMFKRVRDVMESLTRVFGWL